MGAAAEVVFGEDEGGERACRLRRGVEGPGEAELSEND